MSSGYVFFDGVCNFCNDSVRFIIKRDPKGVFKYAPLSSKEAKNMIADTGKKLEDLPDSIVLVLDGKYYDKSSAALEIAKRMNGAWPLFYIFKIIPSFIRNPIYDYFAKNRYKWFGKKETCPMPSPEIRSRFLAVQ
jgi:predicted DCC family thiol-disulfide oxidoreductase YuxK